MLAMETSASRSTTKRTVNEIIMKTGECCSSNGARRRARSLSQFPPCPAPDLAYDPVPEDIIVNTARGSVYPEIILDDLAIEFFPKNIYLDKTREGDSNIGCSSRRSSDIGALNCSKELSQRRGRSITRRNYHSGDGNGRIRTTNEAAITDTNLGRRRSVSVVRSRRLTSDSKSYADHSQSSSSHANRQIPTTLDRRQLEKSAKHKDTSKSMSHIDYSDEATKAHNAEDGIEKIIRAVYARKKPDHQKENNENSSLYESLRRELGHAVEEIRTEVEQATTGRTSASGSSDPSNSQDCGALWAYSAIMRSYETKLEKSEKRKQDLLAKMELEERRGKELSKRVRELLSDSSKRRSLTEKNDGKTQEGLISNAQEKYISSIQRAKRDGSSNFRRYKARGASEQHFKTKSLAVHKSVTVEMDGINFPWLKWDNAQHPVTPKTIWCEVAKSSSSSSRGLMNRDLVSNGEGKERKTCFDMEQYSMLEKTDQLLFVSWKERHRVHSGGLLLCNNLLL